MYHRIIFISYTIILMNCARNSHIFFVPDVIFFHNGVEKRLFNCNLNEHVMSNGYYSCTLFFLFFLRLSWLIQLYRLLIFNASDRTNSYTVENRKWWSHQLLFPYRYRKIIIWQSTSFYGEFHMETIHISDYYLWVLYTEIGLAYCCMLFAKQSL